MQCSILSEQHIPWFRKASSLGRATFRAHILLAPPPDRNHPVPFIENNPYLIHRIVRNILTALLDLLLLLMFHQRTVSFSSRIQGTTRGLLNTPRHCLWLNKRRRHTLGGLLRLTLWFILLVAVDLGAASMRDSIEGVAVGSPKGCCLGEIGRTYICCAYLCSGCLSLDRGSSVGGDRFWRICAWTTRPQLGAGVRLRLYACICTRTSFVHVYPYSRISPLSVFRICNIGRGLLPAAFMLTRLFPSNAN